MKLLFYRYGSICEPDILDTFREIGLDISEFSLEITEKNLPLQESITAVTNELLEHPVDFVFSINFFPFLSEVCNIFHIRYVCWIVDSPVMELYSTSIQNCWNRVFPFDTALYEEFSPYNPDCIFYLPLAANISPKSKLFSESPQETHNRFSHDISFVGSLYTEKSPYRRLQNAPDYLLGFLDGIMSAQEQIYGYFFLDQLLTDETITEFKKHLPGFYGYPAESFLTDRDTMAQLYLGTEVSARERMHSLERLCDHHPVDIYTGSDTSSMHRIRNHGFAKSLTEMPLIFHNAKINLNITSKSIRNGLPLRIFDIISCGGFLLTNYQSDMHGLFAPGEDLAVYTSQDELVELCDYYLHHDKERQEIAMNGYERLKKEHTYLIRIEKMLSTAFSS